MILDKQAELTSTVAYDLGTVRPGPGEGIKLWFDPSAGTSPLVITTGATSAAADDFMSIEYTVGVGQEITLPATVKRYIKATFTGTLNIVSPGCGQTNK
jgi:hypothetical protein